jgi:hypothetical protein
MLKHNAQSKQPLNNDRTQIQVELELELELELQF